jgi:L-rhamnose-H+ transport protein
MEVITGVLYHSVGASCAAMCYTPQRKVAHWSWQTYWLAQAAVCWFLLPLIIAWFTIPNITAVLHEAPADAMYTTFLYGAAYGIGGTAFGMAIRYVGFSLTYAIAVGISCVLGTLLPPLVHGELSSLFGQKGSGLIITGITVGALGIALCGVAGRYKEHDLEINKTAGSNFSLAKGLPLCLLAGVLSAVYGFSIDQGKPIADIAEKYGSGNFKINVVYIFSNTGALLSTLIYCLYLHRKQSTFGEYRLPAANNDRRSSEQKGRAQLAVNFIMAILTGILWYSQFFFYGLGHVRMGKYQYSSWAIHMIMLVLFSSITGLVMKEWIGCRKKTISMLVLALIVLILAVLALTYGNVLSEVEG